MTLLYADFVAGFPEFSDTAKYPVATFNFWAAQADLNVNQRRAARQLTLALCLYVAHAVAMAAKAKADAAVGKTVGEVTGALTSKSVDKVAASYNPTTTIEGAGPYNATLYGQRFYQMMSGLNTAMYVPGPGAVRAGRFGPGFGIRFGGGGSWG